MSNPILSAKNIIKTYSQGGETLQVLKGASLEVGKGEMVGLIGPSGSGKSSFLHILGLLDNHNGGSILINGQECSNLTDEKRTKIRSSELGFIYQFHHLIAGFTALENVTIPLRIQGIAAKEAKEEAFLLLKSLGLESRINHLTSQLSGGEQQRVAIARAIVTGPSLILADEPTGNLDPANAALVFDLLVKIVKNYNLSALIVTHNMDLAKNLDKVYAIENGEIVE